MFVEKGCASDIVGCSRVKMLVESSLCSSIETSPFHVSRFQGPFTGHYWLSHGEPCQMLHKLPGHYEGSFRDPKPTSSGKDFDVSSYQTHQAICPEQTMTNRTSRNGLISRVYIRRKLKTSRNALVSRVYRRRKPVVKPSDRSKGRGDNLSGYLFSGDDIGATKRRADRLENCRVYSRRKWRMKSTGVCTEEHDSREAKRSGDQLDDSLLYYRKKQRVAMTTNVAFSEHCPGKDKRRGDGPDVLFVYNRKKRRVKPSGTSTEHDAGETETCKSRVSAVSSLAARHSHGCDSETDVSNVHESPVAETARVSDRMVNSCTDRTREVGSGNDGCSSSEPVSMNSVTMVTESITKDMSAEAICVSILRSDGLLDGSWHGSTSSHVQETVLVSTSISSRGCKICDQSVAPENMLICDKCEGFFHTHCCSVQMREVSEIDEWLCPSCLKKKQKILNEINSKKRGGASRERKWITSPPRSETCPAAFMLRDAEQYRTGVRIGTSFQAKVPDWSGPTTSDDTLLAAEPLGINQTEHMHHLNINSARKLSSIGNWLQCREEDINGEICGKWRRAPLYEVQTDDWECFCCIFWDPPHADCAVPQEMETNEIMKQLKYMETLRPRLDARRRKGRDVHRDNTSSRL